jgi:hypothetical protein
VVVQVLRLIVFTGRSSALLLINTSALSSSFKHSAHRRSQVELQFNHTSHAFNAYEENVAGVTMHTVAAMSPYGRGAARPHGAAIRRGAARLPGGMSPGSNTSVLMLKMRQHVGPTC